MIISNRIKIDDNDIQLSAIRAQGAGGQHINKVSSAIHLRFSIPASQLPEDYKARLLALNDARITKEGIIIIKAQRFRTQAKNRLDALQRLQTLIQTCMTTEKIRRPSRPSQQANKKRLEGKKQRSHLKKLRSKRSSQWH